MAAPVAEFPCGHARTAENTLIRTEGSHRERCRVCKNKVNRAWHASNRESIHAHKRISYAKNPNPQRNKTKIYQETHKEQVQATKRAYYLANKESILGHNRAYYAENKEQSRAHSRAYYLANKEKAYARFVAWKKANPERMREIFARRRARKHGAIVSKADYAAILAEFGMVCHICGQDIEFLDDLNFDHVIPLAKGGPHSAENIRPSHALCNQQKGASLLEDYELAA